MSMRDQTPWVDRFPSEYLSEHVRYCASVLDGPTDTGQTEGWLDLTDKADLLLYGSNYPHWSTLDPSAAAVGLSESQREKVLWRNAAELFGIDAQAKESVP
jgi:predicted TIM-barrel fold metal-dependent hydrolase